MPEEYKTLSRFADIVEQLLQEQRDESREVYLKLRESVRATLSPQLFELPLDVLAVSQEILDILEPFENVGEVMLTCQVDEAKMNRRLAALEDDPMAELQNALNFVMEADLDQLLEEAFSIEEVEGEELETEDVEGAEAAPEDGVEEQATAEMPADEAAEVVEEVLVDAFGQPSWCQRKRQYSRMEASQVPNWSRWQPSMCR